MFKVSPAIQLDGYKTGHPFQYPEGTNYVNANMTPRASRLNEVTEVIHFGLQYFIKRFLDEWNTNFFNLKKEDALRPIARRLKNYLRAEPDMKHYSDLHDVGYLPIRIDAIPEGMSVPIRVPMFTIHNTGNLGWVTNSIETILSNSYWQGATSATIAKRYRKLLDKYAMETVGTNLFVPYQGHDFSFRGMGGFDASLLSGAGHLTSFIGTDTVPAIDWLEYYYGANSDVEAVGESVFATEHSVQCLGISVYTSKCEYIEEEYDEATGEWIPVKTYQTNPSVEMQNKKRRIRKISDSEKLFVGECLMFKRLITEVHPTGIVSIVSDTYDFWGVITRVLPLYKKEIVNRQGKVVIRPDSGDPVKIVCGDPNAPEGSPEYKGAIECMWDVFGGTISPMGYRLLDEHIGLIYGDSITYERAEAICEGLKRKGFASTNVVLGIGSFTYQYNTRDTFGFAVKSTYGEVNHIGCELFKDPKTDNGIKKSARGLLGVRRNCDGVLELVDRLTKDEYNKSFKTWNVMKPTFIDGRLLETYTLKEIRENVAR